MAVEPLCTLQQVKIQLGITDSSSDALINQLIPGVSQEILNAINRLDLLPSSEYTDQLCGNGKCKLYLKHYPITEVLSVNLNDESVPQWDGYSDSSGWRFLLDPNPENQQFIELIGIALMGNQLPVYMFYSWPYPCSSPQCLIPNVTVHYKAGYDTAPPALSQAAIDFVAFKRSMAAIQAANPLLTARHIGDYSEDMGGGRGVIVDFMGISMPASVAGAIEQYQRMVV